MLFKFVRVARSPRGCRLSLLSITDGPGRCAQMGAQFVPWIPGHTCAHASHYASHSKAHEPISLSFLLMMPVPVSNDKLPSFRSLPADSRLIADWGEYNVRIRDCSTDLRSVNGGRCGVAGELVKSCRGTRLGCINTGCTETYDVVMYVNRGAAESGWWCCCWYVDGGAAGWCGYGCVDGGGAC